MWKWLRYRALINALVLASARCHCAGQARPVLNGLSLFSNGPSGPTLFPGIRGTPVALLVGRSSGATLFQTLITGQLSALPGPTAAGVWGREARKRE